MWTTITGDLFIVLNEGHEEPALLSRDMSERKTLRIRINTAFILHESLLVIINFDKYFLSSFYFQLFYIKLHLGHSFYPWLPWRKKQDVSSSLSPSLFVRLPEYIILMIIFCDKWFLISFAFL